MNDQGNGGYQEPSFLPWEGRQVPLTLLGGYLGAGKTTVINELLARSATPIAVLVNDVGSVNVDAALIRRRNRNTIEFTDGCVCCSLSDGLGQAFNQLRELEEPPSHVILELSGVANPDRVRPWGQSAGFRLDGVVVLVDCDQYSEFVTNPVVATVLETQIRAADILIMTKVDLASDETRSHVVEALRNLAPSTPIMDSSSALASAGILELGAGEGRNQGSTPPVSLFDLHQIEQLPIPEPIQAADFERLLEGLPANTLRAKGIARSPNGKMLLAQVVGKRRVVTELSEAEFPGVWMFNEHDSMSSGSLTVITPAQP